jgi:hypothetical protein
VAALPANRVGMMSTATGQLGLEPSGTAYKEIH